MDEFVSKKRKLEDDCKCNELTEREYEKKVFEDIYNAIVKNNQGGGSLNKEIKRSDKKYMDKLFVCNDGRARKAFRVSGKGNNIFVMYKGICVAARDIPKIQRKKIQ